MHWIGAQFVACRSLDQVQVFKHVKILSDRSKKMKAQKKIEESVLVAVPHTIHKIHNLAL